MSVRKVGARQLVDLQVVRWMVVGGQSGGKGAIWRLQDSHPILLRVEARRDPRRVALDGHAGDVRPNNVHIVSRVEVVRQKLRALEGRARPPNGEDPYT